MCEFGSYLTNQLVHPTIISHSADTCSTQVSTLQEELFQLESMLIGMIANTDQADNITMVQLDKEKDADNAAEEVNTGGEEV